MAEAFMPVVGEEIPGWMTERIRVCGRAGWSLEHRHAAPEGQLSARSSSRQSSSQNVQYSSLDLGLQWAPGGTGCADLL